MNNTVLWIILFIILISLTFGNSRIQQKEEKETILPEIARIVGGVYAKPNQLPYQVRVRTRADGRTSNCGGSIIARKYVLTAYHCINKKLLEKVDVVAGIVDISNPSRIVIDVEKIYLYNKTDDENIANDVALLKMKTPFPVDLPNVKAVRLQEKIGYLSTKCVVSGWGSTLDDLDESMLKVIHIPLTTKKVCNDAYDIRGDVICAGWFKQGGKDACKGDSGGPLVCDGLLTGITKGGNGCAKPNFPGTYTEVAFYVPWINGILYKDCDCYDDGDIQYYGDKNMNKNNGKCQTDFDVSQVYFGFINSGSYAEVTMIF